MTKKTVSRLEREFLEQLKRIEKNEAKTQRKSKPKESKTSRSKKTVRPDRSGRKDTPKKSKLVSASKVQTSNKQVRPGKGKRVERSTKRNTPSVEITRTKRTDQKIHITFKNVRSVKNKIGLLNGSDVDKVLIQQFKRKGSEPPLGFVVTVTGKDGRIASDPAPYDMVVNRKNVKDFTERFLNALKDGNTRYRERNRNFPKSKWTKENNYDDFDPTHAQTVTIKFIYAKN